MTRIIEVRACLVTGRDARGWKAVESYLPDMLEPGTVPDFWAVYTSDNGQPFRWQADYDTRHGAEAMARLLADDPGATTSHNAGRVGVEPLPAASGSEAR